MLILCAAGAIYCAIALVCVLRFGARALRRSVARPAITILKPIHGLEIELFENLCSFCEQAYPRFEVLFGVQRSDDPAIAVVERVIARYPDRELRLIVHERDAAGNPKIANLQGMIASASYDLFFIADADMRVTPDYLACVAAEFDDARVGAATCLYAGDYRGGVASQLAAMQLNGHFAPSVLVATAGAPPRFCFGSTMAVRRDVLESIGGFAALAPHLADDYMLGALVASKGYRVALSPYVVRNVVFEPALRALFDHELRWARTIRMMRPWGYTLSVVTYPLPFALVWLLFSRGEGPAWLMLAVVLALRCALEVAARAVLRVRTPASWWLLPLRDCLSLAVWASGLGGSIVRWQDRTIVTRERGLL